MADAPDTLPAGTQMQGMTAPDTLPANFAVQNVQAPLGTQIANANGMPGGPPPPDPAGLIGNVAKGIQNVGKSFTGLPSKLASDIKQTPLTGNLAQMTFRPVADIAETAFSPVSEGIGAAINTAGNAIPSAKNAVNGGIGAVSDFISNSPVVQKFAMDHPQAEEDFNRALTLILLAAGGPKAGESLPAAGDVAATTKAVGTDLVKSPIQFAKGTKELAQAGGQKAVKGAQNLLMPEIPENVRNAAGKMSTEQIQSLVQAQTENRANSGSFSAMEKVGQTALRDLRTVDSKLSNIGRDKSAIMDSAAGRTKVGNIATKFLQDFNNAVKEKAQLRGDESLVRDIQNQTKLLGNNPSAQAVDRFVDYVQERVYSGSRDLTIPQSDAVEQVARREVGKLNEALKNKMPEAYRTLNKKYSDMVKVRDEFNNAMGKGGDRSANFLKTLFSPFSARVKKVLPQVQALTGNDLSSQAQVAKHIMDVMGATAQKSLLENQTGLNAAPTTLGKMAFDFGKHKVQEALGGEKAQIERLMGHANDAHLQSQTMNAMKPIGRTTEDTIPRMRKNTGNTTTNTEIQKTTPSSTNINASAPSAGAGDMGNKIAQNPDGVKGATDTNIKDYEKTDSTYTKRGQDEGATVAGNDKGTAGEGVSTGGLREGQPAIGSNFTQDAVARERFDIPKLKKLSFGGSDRDVYELPNGNVLKVAKTARGLDQNASSADYYAEDAGLIPKTIERGDNYIVKERVDAPDAKTKEMVKRLKELGGLSQERYNPDAFYKDRQKAIEILDEYGFSGEDIANYSPLWGDFIAIRNWGTRDGIPILLDEGTLSGNLVDNAKSSPTGGTKNLKDPEFKKMYDKSRAAKKKFGDTDKKTMYGLGIAGSALLLGNQQDNKK